MPRAERPATRVVKLARQTISICNSPDVDDKSKLAQIVELQMDILVFGTQIDARRKLDPTTRRRKKE